MTPKSIDTQIQKFEKELLEMDEELLVQNHKLKSMKNYLVNLRR
jgi:hypothetical protein